MRPCGDISERPIDAITETVILLNTFAYSFLPSSFPVRCHPHRTTKGQQPQGCRSLSLARLLCVARCLHGVRAGTGRWGGRRRRHQRTRRGSVPRGVRARRAAAPERRRTIAPLASSGRAANIWLAQVVSQLGDGMFTVRDRPRRPGPHELRHRALADGDRPVPALHLPRYRRGRARGPLGAAADDGPLGYLRGVVVLLSRRSTVSAYSTRTSYAVVAFLLTTAGLFFDPAKNALVPTLVTRAGAGAHERALWNRRGRSSSSPGPPSAAC